MCQSHRSSSGVSSSGTERPPLALGAPFVAARRRPNGRTHGREGRAGSAGRRGAPEGLAPPRTVRTGSPDRHDHPTGQITRQGRNDSQARNDQEERGG